MCFEQLEITKGSTREQLQTNQYYDEEAIRFIETICIFATLDAHHRFVVRALARLLNFQVLAKQENIRASLCELSSESYIIIFFISLLFFFFWNRHVLNFMTRNILLPLKKFFVGLLREPTGVCAVEPLLGTQQHWAQCYFPDHLWLDYGSEACTCYDVRNFTYLLF